MIPNYDAHGLKAYYHDCVMYEYDRIDKNGEPVNYVYAKLPADRVIYRQKYRRALQYARIHELEAQNAKDVARLISCNAREFSEDTYDKCTLYWEKACNNHIRHRKRWLEIAEWLNAKAEER